MDITVKKAVPKDAGILAQTRQIVWEETYRGIYPDTMLDEYDTNFHAQKDRNRMEIPEHSYYLFMHGSKCVGYFSFGPYNYGTYKDFTLCLNNLYILKDYQGRGLGKHAFAILRNYAAEQGIDKFFCGCNAHNFPAQGFYRHMGGQVGNISTGHLNKSDDIIHFEFFTGDTL